MGRRAKIKSQDGRVNLYMDPRLRAALVRKAQSNGRTLNQQIEMMLRAQSDSENSARAAA